MRCRVFGSDVYVRRSLLFLVHDINQRPLLLPALTAGRDRPGDPGQGPCCMGKPFRSALVDVKHTAQIEYFSI